MGSHSERERRQSAPYVQTFVYLQSQRRGRSRRIPRLGLACAAALTVAVVTWQNRSAEAPADRNESLRTIAADPRLDAADVASVPVPPAERTGPAVASADVPPADDVPQVPTPVAETPPAESSQAPQVAAVQEPQQDVPAGPPAPQARVASAPPVHGRTARARSARSPSAYAIRRLLDRSAVEVESGQRADAQVHLLSIRADGDRAVVRFTRRHRYRDALGRLVLKETPPMETTVVKTAEGVRFETSPM
jgi:hypothetical protein